MYARKTCIMLHQFPISSRKPSKPPSGWSYQSAKEVCTPQRMGGQHEGGSLIPHKLVRTLYHRPNTPQTPSPRGLMSVADLIALLCLYLLCKHDFCSQHAASSHNIFGWSEPTAPWKDSRAPRAPHCAWWGCTAAPLPQRSRGEMGCNRHLVEITPQQVRLRGVETFMLQSTTQPGWL